MFIALITSMLGLVQPALLHQIRLHQPHMDMSVDEPGHEGFPLAIHRYRIFGNPRRRSLGNLPNKPILHHQMSPFHGITTGSVNQKGIRE